MGGVLTVANGPDSSVVGNDGFLTLKKKVPFREWTKILETDACTASRLVECEPGEDEHWLYRPCASETAGARYQEWLGWYLRDKNCLLYKKCWQFWCGVCVESGWTTTVDEVTL